MRHGQGWHQSCPIFRRRMVSFYAIVFPSRIHGGHHETKRRKNDGVKRHHSPPGARWASKGTGAYRGTDFSAMKGAKESPNGSKAISTFNGVASQKRLRTGLKEAGSKISTLSFSFSGRCSLLFALIFPSANAEGSRNELGHCRISLQF